MTNGTTARDWIGDGLTAKQLTAYTGPTDEELERAGVLAVFLGYYFRWDPATSLAGVTSRSVQIDLVGRPKTQVGACP